MKWLGREMVTGPHLMLALSEKDFFRGVRGLRVPRQEWPKWWVSEGAVATVHQFKNPGGSLACIVGLKPTECDGPVDVACTLVHEAVHVFQMWCDFKGEQHPSKEFEAYSIEAIAKILMQAYKGAK